MISIHSRHKPLQDSLFESVAIYFYASFKTLKYHHLEKMLRSTKVNHTDSFPQFKRHFPKEKTQNYR